jgi:hypothetical protein
MQRSATRRRKRSVAVPLKSSQIVAYLGGYSGDGLVNLIPLDIAVAKSCRRANGSVSLLWNDA